MRHTRRSIALAIGVLACAPTIAGCAATGSSDSGSSDSGSAGATGGVSSYRNGDYSAAGDYQSPGGAESIEVTLRLADGVVTDVTVTGNASGGNAERYQSQFAEGISAEVVGKNIADLSVDKVAGSSLTSDGFNAAVEQIKADASA